ncbi:hypothetical protein CC78DRAFT_5554 [Lojkania enalia]|uniref:Rrn9 domain-containing protein n=1 Tax=Lojkania enalia TaxID=147567 RepID=A0A9P4TRY0_9PLEO|nr:hypothetical protein CC78DRAFT_5554 [Didymosphaeria enalia]
MSLYGASSFASSPRTPHSDENELPPASPASSTAAHAETFLNAQNTQISDDDFHVYHDNDLYIDDNSEDDSEPRPNRFAGKPSTWREYTAADRHIAASLDQLESGDLAAHLYNAHALRRRARLPPERLRNVRDWKSKNSWMKEGQDLRYIDAAGEIQTELVPSKLWTAWPLPLPQVPTPNERFWRGVSDDEGNGSNAGHPLEQEVGDELREEVLALFLRLAKDQWEAREVSGRFQEDMDDEGIARPRSRSRSVRSERAALLAPSRDGSDSDVEMSNTSDLKEDKDTISETGSKEKSARLIGKRKYNRKSGPPSAKPVILADDDKARQILWPSINSLLAQVDSLATAVSQSRLNHFGRGAHSNTSESDLILDAGSVTSRSRSRSTSIGSERRRTRVLSRVSSITDPPLLSMSHQNDSEATSSFGTDQEATKRAARSGKSTPKQKRDGSRTKDADENRAGLMDWSELLGTASVGGWNEKAIAKTAQRCAALFNESMAFRAFDENLALKTVPEPVLYTPSRIPGPDVLGIDSASASKRPYFEKGTLRCPHRDCWGHKKEFNIPYRVIEHIQRNHGYDPRTNDSDNEERTYGGVHIDGFMQPIYAKSGWLGAGRAKSAGENRIPKVKKKRHESEPSSLVPSHSSPM